MRSASASYLDRPRLHFAGRFRVDTGTRNNMNCNFDPDIPLVDDQHQDWNVNGTTEFSLFDTKVTSFVGSDDSTTSVDVSNLFLTENRKRPYAKIVDLDVDHQGTSVVYGMTFSLVQANADGSETVIFVGDWKPNVVSQNMWHKKKYYDRTVQPYDESFPFGALTQTVLVNVEWSNKLDQDNTTLSLLKKISKENNNTLSISISLYGYSRNYLGYVVGSIGPYQEGEPTNIAGPRWLRGTHVVPHMVIEEDDSCYGKDLDKFKQWVSSAPFMVSTDRVSVDLSNSLPIHVHGSMRDIGDLRVGIQHDTCVEIISPDSIPYMTLHWMENTGGVVECALTQEQHTSLTENNLKLVLVQMVSSGGDALCSDSVFPSLKSTHSAKVLLSEVRYVLRPTGVYVGYVDEDHTLTINIYVTDFGEPAVEKTVTIFRKDFIRNLTPANGVSVTSESAKTDASGRASFTFEKRDVIPFPRQYHDAKYRQIQPCADLICKEGICTLPIEGQGYRFAYRLNSSEDTVSWNVVILGFSDFTPPAVPTWVEDIEPIFARYKRLTPIMNTILDLGDYKDVTLTRNIEMLKLSMNRDRFLEADFMPTTRDLSFKKTKMVLQWLDNPICSTPLDVEPDPTDKICHPPVKNLPGIDFPPTSFLPRCQPSATLKFDQSPGVYPSGLDSEGEEDESNSTLPIKGRPLKGLVGKFKSRDTCMLEDLQTQLQTALELEFATIPLYLTSLYSFGENCNLEADELITSVVRQEMLHFAQAANLLIATGQYPLIDSETVAPTYPTHLPGGVLPDLYVTLKKASLLHIYYTFMGVEAPAFTEGSSPPVHAEDTIGQFYDEIKTCIDYLYSGGNEVFSSDTSDQVPWPWNSTVEEIGSLVIVTDKDSALEAVEQVITQGEGAGELNAQEISKGQLPHFFRFEEIVCQKRLVADPETVTYSYSGEAIPFNANGVWPMRDNPTAYNLIPNTNCYTEAKAFHHVYRSLLRSLQETFSGHPDQVTSVVPIMETMQAHAKRLMWVKYNPHNEADLTTCGPVFDYNWPFDEADCPK